MFHRRCFQYDPVGKKYACIPLLAGFEKQVADFLKLSRKNAAQDKKAGGGLPPASGVLIQALCVHFKQLIDPRFQLPVRRGGKLVV